MNFFLREHKVSGLPHVASVSGIKCFPSLAIKFDFVVIDDRLEEEWLRLERSFTSVVRVHQYV